MSDNIHLIPITPAPNEKGESCSNRTDPWLTSAAHTTVLLYLEGMRESQVDQLGSPLSSGFPNLAMHSRRSDIEDEADEVDSNIQEGRKTEITVHSTGAVSPFIPLKLFSTSSAHFNY